MAVVRAQCAMVQYRYAPVDVRALHVQSSIVSAVLAPGVWRWSCSSWRLTCRAGPAADACAVLEEDRPPCRPSARAWVGRRDTELLRLGTYNGYAFGPNGVRRGWDGVVRRRGCAASSAGLGRAREAFPPPSCAPGLWVPGFSPPSARCLPLPQPTPGLVLAGGVVMARADRGPLDGGLHTAEHHSERDAASVEWAMR